MACDNGSKRTGCRLARRLAASARFDVANFGHGSVVFLELQITVLGTQLLSRLKAYHIAGLRQVIRSACEVHAVADKNSFRRLPKGLEPGPALGGEHRQLHFTPSSPSPPRRPSPPHSCKGP